MVISNQSGQESFGIIATGINMCFVAYLALGQSLPQLCRLEVWGGLMEPHPATGREVPPHTPGLALLYLNPGIGLFWQKVFHGEVHEV